jgi:hypothetical protein
MELLHMQEKRTSQRGWTVELSGENDDFKPNQNRRKRYGLQLSVEAILTCIEGLHLEMIATD